MSEQAKKDFEAWFYDRHKYLTDKSGSFTLSELKEGFLAGRQSGVSLEQVLQIVEAFVRECELSLSNEHLAVGARAVIPKLKALQSDAPQGNNQTEGVNE